MVQEEEAVPAVHVVEAPLERATAEFGPPTAPVGTFPPTAYSPVRFPLASVRAWPDVAIAVVKSEETVIDSPGARSVVFPAASFGVIVKVAESVAAMDAEDALNVKDAGALATVHTTVTVGSPLPVKSGRDASVPLFSLSSHTRYEIVAYFVVTVSAARGIPVEVEPLSGWVLKTCAESETVEVELSALRVAADWVA
jgi:hypothetical protein